MHSALHLLLTQCFPLNAQQDFSPMHAHIHTDMLLHCGAGMSPDRMTPVKLQDTDQQHNRNAESSVNGTIVFLRNKAQSEHRSTAHQPALVGNRVMGYTTRHNTPFVEVPEYIIAVSRFYTKITTSHPICARLSEGSTCRGHAKSERAGATKVINFSFLLKG